MSQHFGQKSRRLASPSSLANRGCGPVRATKTFALGSPSDPLSLSSSSIPLSPNSSTNDGGKRRSASSTVWTENLSPGYSGFTQENKLICRPSERTIRRSASFDTITLNYLCGEWPRSGQPLIHLNLVHCPIVLTADKWTQTTDDSEDHDSDSTARHQLVQKHLDTSCHIVGGGINGSCREIRTRLCHSARGSPSTGFGDGGRGINSPTSDVISVTTSVMGDAGFPSLGSRSRAIVIPVVNRRNPLAPCQGSAEGFNQEIEKLVRKTGTSDSDLDLSKTQAPTPDGHRAPIADLLSTRNVDTQTPSGGLFHSGIEKHFLRILEDSSDDSPSLPIIPGAGDAPMLFNRPASAESDTLDQCEQVISETVSPASFILLAKTCEKREAPDGCERKQVELAKNTETLAKKEIYHDQPDPMKTNNIFKCLIPSERSAFCPLLKKYVSQQTILSFSASEKDNSIEAK